MIFGVFLFSVIDFRPNGGPMEPPVIGWIRYAAAASFAIGLWLSWVEIRSPKK